MNSANGTDSLRYGIRLRHGMKSVDGYGTVSVRNKSGSAFGIEEKHTVRMERSQFLMVIAILWQVRVNLD